MGILINSISGYCLLISSLPGSSLITHVELSALPGKRDIKKTFTYIVFSIYRAPVFFQPSYTPTMNPFVLLCFLPVLLQ